MAHNANNNYYNSPTPYGPYAVMSGSVPILGSVPNVPRMSLMQGQQMGTPQTHPWPYQQQYQPKPPEMQPWGHQQNLGPSTSTFQPNRSLVPHYGHSGNMGPPVLPVQSTMGMGPYPAVNLPQYIPTPVMQNPFQVTRATGYDASSITPSTRTVSEYDEDFSEKLISYARFNRNTNLMKDILSEVMIPEVSQVVTTTRLENLKIQVRAIEEHTAKMQKEIAEMSERYRKKREEFVESNEKFHAEYPRECKRKTFTQRSLERIEAKWYHRFKSENPRNWGRYLVEPGPIPKAAIFIKPTFHLDYPVEEKKPIAIKPEQPPPPAPSSTPEIDCGVHSSPYETVGTELIEGSSLMDQKDAAYSASSSQINSEFEQELSNQTDNEMNFKDSHKNPLCGKDLLISGSENYLRALLNRGSSNSPVLRLIKAIPLLDKKSMKITFIRFFEFYN